MTRRQLLAGPLALRAARTSSTGPSASLPSWTDGEARRTILRFVADVTREGGPSYVPPAQRIAVFDNDGTLWCEQPVYAQAAFAFARVRDLVAERPALASQQPYKAVIEKHLAALAAQGQAGIVELMTATHTGMTTTEFEALARRWMSQARNPRFARPYTSLVYRPMIDLLALLRAHAFETFIVSGGGVDFIRLWSAELYGVPPERVVGSTGKVAFRMRDERPILDRVPGVDFVDDGPGKPVGIHRFIGRKPIFAAGNSDGDLQMLQFVAPGPGPALGLIVHHDDAAREYAYDRTSPVGKLDRAIDEARQRGWLMVSMARDFATVFDASPQPSPADGTGAGVRR